MGNRSELIKVRVTEEQHEKISEHLEKTEEYGSLSTFGQHVLVDYVRDDGESSEQQVSIDSEDIMEAVEMGLSPVSERLERIESDILELQNMVQTDTVVRELADQLYDNLIQVPDGQTIEDMSPLQPDEAALVGSPEAFAGEFGEDQGAVRRALDMAENLYPDVDYIVDKTGDRRYYRIEQ